MTKIATRDMYNPSCLGHPNNTANMMCSFTDYGGVHDNSGLSNYFFMFESVAPISQLYSLLADGGTYGGTTYTGIGLLKVRNRRHCY